MGDELPAVMAPSFVKAGRNLPRPSAVESGRTPWSSDTVIGSPLRWGTSMGAISSAKIPSCWALPASWWLRAATASCSARSI